MLFTNLGALLLAFSDVLQEMSSSPVVFKVKSFKDLDKLAELMYYEICTGETNAHHSNTRLRIICRSAIFDDDAYVKERYLFYPAVCRSNTTNTTILSKIVPLDKVVLIEVSLFHMSQHLINICFSFSALFTNLFKFYTCW